MTGMFARKLQCLIQILFKVYVDYQYKSDDINALSGDFCFYLKKNRFLVDKM